DGAEEAVGEARGAGVEERPRRLHRLRDGRVRRRPAHEELVEPDAEDLPEERGEGPGVAAVVVVEDEVEVAAVPRHARDELGGEAGVARVLVGVRETRHVRTVLLDAEEATGGSGAGGVGRHGRRIREWGGEPPDTAPVPERAPAAPNPGPVIQGLTPLALPYALVQVCHDEHALSPHRTRRCPPDPHRRSVPLVPGRGSGGRLQPGLPQYDAPPLATPPPHR